MSDRYLMNRRKRSSLDRELDVLQVQLQTISRREVHVQKVLDDIQQLKDEVLSERAAVEEKISDLEAQKEPINWLPPELLEQVFFAVTDFDLPNSKYRPQVVVSHVCMKWRIISLASPRLWSRINLQGFAKPDPLLTFLKRSGKAPLEIDYRSLDVSATQECSQVADMIIQTQQHFGRVNYLTLQSRAALPLVYILPSINNHNFAFPRLHYLCLSITDPNPTFVEVPSLMESINVAPADPSSLKEPSPSTSCLSRLKLERVPLFKFVTPFIANLRCLELSYSPRRLNNTGYDYYLKMSSLCHFLAHTPLLEELVLNNTVPYFDVILATDGTDNLDIPYHRPPVNLVNLKTLEWSYPFAVDIYRFLSLIDAPGLEKLDLWVEDFPAKRNDTLFVRGYMLTSSSPHKYSRGIVNYPSVRDLSLQCVGEDTTSSVLRKFSFPALEKLAFTNVDSTVRQNPEIATALPVFPRLESIFRDPRLPILTHLTLSHFKISAELGRAEAMLGYMPVLTSLSLDACSGVGRLMEGLQEKVVGTIKTPASPGEGRGKRRRRGVKVCPRLEALSFWGCQDVDFGALRAVVLSRNGSNNDHSEDEADVQTGVDAPKGASQSVTREDQPTKIESDYKTEEAKMGREIKPLRKMRRFGHEPGLTSALGAMDPSANIVSTFIAAQESLQPANIVYLRVANCKLIEEKEASSLRDLGVGDVIWAGSDSG